MEEESAIIESNLLSEIIDFWFSDNVQPKWFNSDKDFDKKIQEKFLSVYELGVSGQLVSWEATPEGSLALIILFDQFPRNMFRNSPQAFATDSAARKVADRTINKKFDTKLEYVQRSFLYMPFMHSENWQDQERSVELYTELGNEMNLKYAILHKEIIDRFNRFPHRNKVLGRPTTKEEALFLKENPGF